MKKFIRAFVTLLTGFTGGVAGAIIFNSSPLLAAAPEEKIDSARSMVDLYNSESHRIAYLGPGQISQGTFFLFDERENVRLQMGTYPGYKEKGQPLIGLHDRKQRLRMLLRLNNLTDVPTLIFKDSYGQDRMVIGLNAATEDPYIEFTDKSGSTKRLVSLP